MADGPDDPKQKADKAWRWCERQWDRAPSPSQMVEAAVSASIAAALVEALAPVLERVARLEEENASMTVEALADAVQAVLATLKQREADGPAVTPAPCATCGGARWVCDVSVDGASYHRKPCPDCSKPAASMVTDLRGTIAPGTAISVDVGPGQNLSPAESEGTLQHNPGLGSVTMSTEQAAALLKSSKPAASTEGHEFAGRIMWTVEGVPIDLRKPASLGECCVLGCDKPTAGASAFCMERHHAPPQNPSPAESEGETACTRHRQYRCPACAAGMVEEPQNLSPAESEGSGQWRAGRSIGRTLYIGDKCIGMVDTPELAAAIVAAMNAPSRSASDPASPDCGNPRRCEHAKAEHAIGHGCTARLPDGSECECGWYPPAPPATQGIPQSGPQAPERIRLQFRGGTPFIGGTLQPALNVSDAEYVRADLLASAERRIVDCRHEAMLEVLHEAENPSQTPIGSPGSIMSRARDIGLKAKKREHMITHDVVVARAEGREAGIREAAEVARAMRDADTGPSEYAQGARQGLQLAGRRILALLAKKPEVGT